MVYLFPIMTVFIAARLPSALALYWTVSTLFGVIQQYIVEKEMGLLPSWLSFSKKSMVRVDKK